MAIVWIADAPEAFAAGVATLLAIQNGARKSPGPRTMMRSATSTRGPSAKSSMAG